MAVADRDPGARRLGHLTAGLLTTVGLGVLLLVVERLLELRIKELHGIWAELLRAAIILAAGVVAARLLERNAAARPPAGSMAARQFTMFRYLARFVLYLVVVLALLAAFGVGLSSVVFGGAFLTVIVGLAGQTVFGNLLSGLVLVLFHPFAIGDRISFMTWQYPVLMPSFPHESTMPAYTGMVTDVNLLYTYVELENGMPVAVPNGIVLQAAVLNHSQVVRRVVRIRFDVDIAFDPEVVAARVRDGLEGLPVGSPERPTVELIDLSPTAFSLLLKVPVPSQVSDDAVRDAALARAASVVRALADERRRAQAGTSPAPAGGT